jgi:hypothetical protein
VVPTYHGNSKLSFSKTLLQRQQFEKSFISNKRCFGFKKSLLKKITKNKQTLPCFIKSFQDSKLCEINYCLGVKTTLKKYRILKSFAPFKTFGLFQIF